MARLLWLPEVLREAGLTVHEVGGWRTRGKESLGPVKGITIHCTASKNSDEVELGILVKGRKGKNPLPGPISQLYLGRQGHWWVVASGIANHNLVGWSGPNKGLGNPNLLGIEAANDNKTEQMPSVQYRSYVRGVAALVRKLGIVVHRVGGHKEHQPAPAPPVPPGKKPKTTKTDPRFSMNQFRTDVALALAGKEGEMDPRDRAVAANINAHLFSLITLQEKYTVPFPGNDPLAKPISFSNAAVKLLNALAARVDLDPAELVAIQTAAAAGAATVAASNAAEEVVELLLARLPDDENLTRAEVESVIRSVLT